MTTRTNADPGDPTSPEDRGPGTEPDETDVPPDADIHVCAYCGRPFAREEFLALHRGLSHWDRLTDGERDRFEETYAAEADDIRRFRIVALGVLVLLYFGFLFAYAIFASGNASEAAVAGSVAFRGPSLSTLLAA